MTTFLKRGGAFVVAQAALLALIGLSGARSGRRGSALGLALMLAGLALGLRGGQTLGRNLTPLPEPVPDGQLVTGGAYSVVRHPIYAALLLGGVGWGVYRRSGAERRWAGRPRWARCSTSRRTTRRRRCSGAFPSTPPTAPA